ncbi:MAG: radical SAM protein [Candidatus Hodarchaeota archaeon]
MNLNYYPYVPKHIVLRRYDQINIYDLKNDESYVIDNEAYSVLKNINGTNSNKEIVEKYHKNKQKEVIEALDDFHELNIINLSQKAITDTSKISLDHIDISDQNLFDPPFLKNLMINITEKCNLKCKHCYIADKNLVDFPLDKLKEVIKDFYQFQGIRLILTGGEPFLYSKLKDLLIFLKDVPIQKVLLSNGLLIKDNQEILDLLKNNYFEVYVSVDGLEASHNDFRDADCYKDTIDGIMILLENNINTSINTMVHKQNLSEFDDLFKLLNSLGKIKNWSIDIPTFDDSTPQSIKDKYEISFEEGGRILKHYGWGVIFESESESNDFAYACGPHLMAIDVVGVITKCGFFTEKSVGNIFDLGIKKGWELIQKSLNWCLEDLKCSEENCKFIGDCRGGCRYRGFKYTGDIYGVDSFKCYQFGKLIK